MIEQGVKHNHPRIVAWMPFEADPEPYGEENEMTKPKFGEWIPIKYHDSTEEEKEEFGEDTCFVLDNPMPSDGEEIFICTKSRDIYKDVAYEDDGWMLDSGLEWIDHVAAWMPLPKPYADPTADTEMEK